MGGRLGCQRCTRRASGAPPLTDRVIAQALLLVEERLGEHDLQLQRLEETAERQRLEAEAASRWFEEHTPPAVRVEESSTQTPEMVELGPIWAAWDVAQGRPWSADLVEARRAREYRQTRAAASSGSRSSDTPRGPRFWERDS